MQSGQNMETENHGCFLSEAWCMAENFTRISHCGDKSVKPITT